MVCVCVRACVCACVRACVRACVHACVCVLNFMIIDMFLRCENYPHVNASKVCSSL